jgi:hypothetical protein
MKVTAPLQALDGNSVNRKLSIMMSECQHYEPEKRPTVDQLLEILNKIDPADQTEQSAADALVWWKKVVLPPLKDQLRKGKAAIRLLLYQFYLLELGSKLLLVVSSSEKECRDKSC